MAPLSMDSPMWCCFACFAMHQHLGRLEKGRGSNNCEFKLSDRADTRTHMSHATCVAKKYKVVQACKNIPKTSLHDWSQGQHVGVRGGGGGRRHRGVVSGAGMGCSWRGWWSEQRGVDARRETQQTWLSLVSWWWRHGGRRERCATEDGW